jgi:hypothetical protein
VEYRYADAGHQTTSPFAMVRIARLDFQVKIKKKMIQTIVTIKWSKIKEKIMLARE